MGRLEVFRWLNPDESLLRGVRPYAYGDPFKHIAMNASASTGEWMIKQYASSTDIDVVLVLNVQFHAQHWYSTDSRRLNDMASTLGTLVRHLEERGYRLHFATNGVLPSRPGRMFHTAQSAAGIRRLLGEMQAYANADFSELWHEVMKNTPDSAQVVLASGFFTDSQEQLLERGKIEASRIHVIPFPAPVIVDEAVDAS